MTGTTVTRGEQARQFYNAAATASATFSFMNYGYAPLTAALARSQEPERYCLQLYEHLIGATEITGKRLVEVSCGRGGGAAHVAATYRPAEYTGIDISEENVRLAALRGAGQKNLRFMTGNAESLPLADASCHALINVEAAHLYDNPVAFFTQVHRVLEPGGVFLHADLAWKDKDPESMIAAAGFTLTSVEDITGNVLESLELDSARREAIVASFPAHMQNDFRDWSGIRGFRAYNRFKSREWIYRCIHARRSGAGKG
jgi:ubiquinone/menaquinone biosynthesis C-methylase UbiE